jgi:hypothetical protein
MKSEVDDTLGFSRTIVATGTPLFVEITPKVSPGCTVQNFRPAVVVVDLWVVVAVVGFAVVVGACLRGSVGRVCVSVVFPPAFIPDRMRSTAIVAASRKAAGAT